MTILITGVAGFIGSHLASKMLSQNFNVLGIDNLNNYYSVNLKKYRLKQLNKFKNFTFLKADLSKAINLEKVIKKKKNKCYMSFSCSSWCKVFNYKPEYLS